MVRFNLSSKTNKVFESLVTTYIELGIPVGSLTLHNRSCLYFSPATIRNIMRELEDTGFVTHIHTSSGRIPTDAGYRYYVDNIMEPEKLTKEEETSISSGLRSAKAQPEALLERVVWMLSEVTNQASMVLFPRFKKNLLKHIKLVSLENNKAVAILITAAGLTKIKEFKNTEARDDLYLQKIAGFINNNCANKPLDQIRDILETIELLASDSSYYLCRDALDILEKIDVANEADKLFLDGAHYLFGQPEFKDVKKSNKLLKIFEEKKELLQFVEERLDEGCASCEISIGKENPHQNIRECSIILSRYGAEGNTLGAIGVIGPTRIPYKRLISVVNCIASQIGRVLEGIE